ncbi:MAG: 3-hydroxyacyl-CoA dehydrogenase family protein [Ginsengibacter sp.]
MKVIVVANVEQQQEIASKNTKPAAEVAFIKTLSEIEPGHYDALFYLTEDHSELDVQKLAGKPVFINAVVETLEQNKWPLHVCRINGWPGFLQNAIWEVATNDPIPASQVFEKLGWKAVFVGDKTGLISPRVISMIINEAFFAIEEEVSTTREIDLAMKLGTNYPFGPFEWIDKIGVQNIYLLLKNLSLKDKRYVVAPLLEKKYLEFIDSQKA